MSEEQTRNAQPPLSPGQFFGEVLNKRKRSGLILSEFEHKRARKLPRHSHELAFFNLLLDGDYKESFGKGTAVLQPLTTIFHPSGVTHHDEIGPHGIRIFSVEIEDHWIDRIREYGVVPESSVSPPGSELGWLATRLYREYRAHQCCSPIAIEGLVLEMLALVARSKIRVERQAPVWLGRAVDLLKAGFHQRITINQVAVEVGVHPVHLSKVFRQFHQQTIGDYLHQLRVELACRMLADDEFQLAAIANAAGFADQSHFTRVFKGLTGMTPGTFRAQFAKKSTGHRPDAVTPSPGCQ